MRAIWTRLAPGIATLALALASGSVSAQFSSNPCSPSGDFVTGGGFIIPNSTSGDHANFGVAGACKNGFFWGHLEYIDHGIDLNVHWTSITAYIEVDSGYDSRGKPIGVRGICGTARTNFYGDVDFLVRARDAGEPGTMDEFDIRLSKNGGIVYSTEFFDFPHKLNDGNGGGGFGGGNIQLHQPNNSTTGTFGFFGDGKCPALDFAVGA